MTDSAHADHATTERQSRRALLGAGAVGVALALAGGRPAAATTGLSDDDLAIGGFAIRLELAVRDLYDAAIDAGADGDVWVVMREQHEAYAQQLAGVTGLSAGERDDATFDSLVAEFATADPLAAALAVENTAAATHTDLLGRVDDDGMAAAMASFVSMESRHATVLAGLAGDDDLDTLFLNTATPLSPEA